MSTSETSSVKETDAVRGENFAAGGVGVRGVCNAGSGVYGGSQSGRGLEGWSTSGYGASGDSQTSAGVRGTSSSGRGIEGWSTAGEGVFGIGHTGGLFDGNFEGVHAVSHDPGAAGVAGYNDNTGIGVFGKGKTGGVFEGTFEGVHAISHDAGAAGVAGFNDSTGPGIYGKSDHGPAAFFAGDVVITGVINLVRADYAEDFTVSDPAEVLPGMLMVLNEDCSVRASEEAYDGHVAGVVSGAGSFQPAVVLDHLDGVPNRMPLALMGKVFCMVDADLGGIAVGDLLTTSTTRGHAMKAANRERAFGAVVGKALGALSSGRGLLPVLVRLQ